MPEQEESLNLASRGERQTAVLSGIARIFREALTCETEEELGQVCLGVAEELTDSRFGFIGEVNPETNRLEDVAMSDISWEECRIRKAETGRRAPCFSLELRGLFGEVVENGQSMYSNDPPAHPASIGTPEGHPALQSFLGVPLQHAGKTHGLIALANRPGGYGSRDVEAIEGLAPAVVQAFISKRAQEDLRKSERIYRRLADANLVGVSFGDSKGNVSFVNDEMLRMMGRTREEYEQGRIDWTQCIAPEYQDEMPEWFERLEQEGVMAAYERAFLKPDGGRTPYIGAAAMVGTGEDLQVSFAIDLTPVREAQRELRESESRLRLAAAAAAVGVFEWDARNDAAVWENQRMYDIFGRTREQGPLTEKEFLGSVVFPEDRAEVKQAVEDAFRTNQEFHAECRIRRCGDGDLRWIEFLGRFDLDPEGQPLRLVGVVADITERKQKEQALQENEERLRRLFDTTLEGIWQIDSEMRTVYVNERMSQMLGYPKDYMIGRRIDEFMAPEDMADVRQKEENRRQGISEVYERGLLRKDGTRLWTSISATPLRDEDGQLTGSFGMFTDITERRLAQRERDRFFDLSLDMLGIASTRDGRWRRTNPAMTNTLGWSREELLDVPFHDIVHPNDRARSIEATQELAEGKPLIKFEHRVRCRDGSYKWIAWNTAPYLDEGLMYCVGRDVTDRKRAEEELRRLNETLEQRVEERTNQVQCQANQLRALASQLSRTEQRERKRLAKILHDHIQQLMVAARMQVAWLKRGSDNPEDMRAVADGVDAILQEALGASRSLTVDLSPPVLHDAGLMGGLNWLAHRMRDKHHLTVNVVADSSAEPAAEETRYLLFECVRELLFNIVKHAGVSEADISVARTPEDEIRIVVAEQGKGFDPELLNNRQGGEGTFGLFSIQERLAHVGGRMEIETAPGEGAAVFLTAPLGAEVGAGEQARTTEEEAAEAIDIRRRGSRIGVLIVDDHKMMREGLRQLLEFESDIEVEGEASDGPEAIKLAEQLLPDVVIMDVNLGEMNGIETTRQILSQRPDTKVIGLSMHMDRDIAEAMHDAGAETYLTKTGPSEDLIAAVRACGDGAA